MDAGSSSGADPEGGIRLEWRLAPSAAIFQPYIAKYNMVWSCAFSRYYSEE